MSQGGQDSAPTPLAVIARALTAVVLVAYPFMVYLGITRFSARSAALALLALMVPGALLRLRRAHGQDKLTRLLIPALIAATLGLGALMNQGGFVLMVPVVVNAGLLLTFGATLRVSPPMIERFARLQVEDLTPAERGWCRTWTWIWCAFFTLNGVTAFVLAVAAPISWWTLYNGLLAYGLIGLLCASEYILRKRRFGRFSEGLLDRLLSSILRRRSSEP